MSVKNDDEKRFEPVTDRNAPNIFFKYRYQKREHTALQAARAPPGAPQYSSGIEISLTGKCTIQLYSAHAHPSLCMEGSHH